MVLHLLVVYLQQILVVEAQVQEAVTPDLVLVAVVTVVLVVAEVTLLLVVMELVDQLELHQQVKVGGLQVPLVLVVLKEQVEQDQPQVVVEELAEVAVEDDPLQHLSLYSVLIPILLHPHLTLVHIGF
jgi:hypothetical protein